MKEQIQILVAQGSTEQALDLLMRCNSDALLLKARYTQGKKQNNMGVIGFGEWSRLQSQVNYAILEMANSLKQTVVVNNFGPTNVYITFLSEIDKPGNELALFNRTFAALKTMLEDQHYPLDEIRQAVKALDRHLSMPDLIDALEDFDKTRYTGNTEAYKTEKRKEFVQGILELKTDVIEAVTEIVTERQRKTGWKEAWNLVCESPTKTRWENARAVISERLNGPTFSDSQRGRWTQIADSVSAIPENFLWRSKFQSFRPDVSGWLSENIN